MPFHLQSEKRTYNDWALNLGVPYSDQPIWEQQECVKKHKNWWKPSDESQKNTQTQQTYTEMRLSATTAWLWRPKAEKTMVLINCWGLGQGAWIEMHRQHRTNSSMSSTDMIRKLWLICQISVKVDKNLPGVWWISPDSWREHLSPCGGMEISRREV
jgi:hypothetical protein